MSRYDFSAPRLCLEASLAAGVEIALGREQTNYLVNVLRLGVGDSILVFNGRDGEWLARLAAASKKAFSARVVELRRAQERGPDIQYAFAPLKHARLDYIVQKAVEMGASRLTPVLTARTQARRINAERMRANAVEAAEQCGVLALPAIDAPLSLEAFLAARPADRLLVFCDEDAPVADPVAALAGAAGAARGVSVLIGPEGGFDERERRSLAGQPGAIAISLGPRILRADTAGVAALALVGAVLGDWKSRATGQDA